MTAGGLARPERPETLGQSFGSAPQVLFRAPLLGNNDLYDLTGDGQSVLVPTGEEYRPKSATVLLNWFESLPKG